MMRLLPILALLLTACGAAAPAFVDSGFYCETNRYLIPYLEGKRRLLDDSWRVSNFAHEDGEPTYMLDKGEYVRSLEWTFSSGETKTVTGVIYDLLLYHRSNATIWVRVLPIPTALTDKDVRVLAENYVNHLSGSAATDYLEKELRQRRVATKILSSRTVGFGQYHAQAVTFDVVNLDQLEMDPDAPRTRVEIWLARVPFRKELNGPVTFEVRGYLLLGYSNDAHHFDTQLATFHELVKRIRVLDTN